MFNFRTEDSIHSAYDFYSFLEKFICEFLQLKFSLRVLCIRYLPKESKVKKYLDSGWIVCIEGVTKPQTMTHDRKFGSKMA